MKNSLACPKCSAGDLWVIDEVQQLDFRSHIGTIPMVVHAMLVNLKDSIINRWLHPNPYERIVAGKLEAWICASCGYIEWYGKGMNEGLEKMSNVPGSGVRRIRREKERGPFR